MRPYRRSYLLFVLKHKWFVLVAGARMKVPLLQLIVHDWTKFLPSEFPQYATWFYADKTYMSEEQKRQARVNFLYAWAHHLRRNPHHWQHHILVESGTTLQLMRIPDRYVREMVADWMGAGRAINGKWEARDWYSKNRDRIMLESSTRRRVEELLSTI